MNETEEIEFKKELQDKLAKEYERYIVVERLVNLSNLTRYRVSLERVLLSMAGDTTKNRKDPVFLDIDKDHSYYKDHFYFSVRFEKIENTEMLIDRIKADISSFLKKENLKK